MNANDRDDDDGRRRRLGLDSPTCLCYAPMRQEINTRMPTRSGLLRFSVCATISTVVAAASDANASAQANVGLHGRTPSGRTRFVRSRPTNENMSMILFGSQQQV